MKSIKYMYRPENWRHMLYQTLYEDDIDAPLFVYKAGYKRRREYEKENYKLFINTKYGSNVNYSLWIN